MIRFLKTGEVVRPSDRLGSLGTRLVQPNAPAGTNWVPAKALRLFFENAEEWSRPGFLVGKTWVDGLYYLIGEQKEPLLCRREEPDPQEENENISTSKKVGLAA